MNNLGDGEEEDEEHDKESEPSDHFTDTNAINLHENTFQLLAVDQEMRHSDAEPSKEYFKANLTHEAKFQLSPEDWTHLKTLQRGHRFQRGEWEDYFVTGMKLSNKHCVFAFKDHYVNQTCIRQRQASMDTPSNHQKAAKSKLDSQVTKVFSAQGYCVFEDCSVKFLLKMNAERVVHVFYTGELKHRVNQVNARYFRGKSRHELKEVLRHKGPRGEFLQRVKSNAREGNLAWGNADYAGKSESVYKRIAAEAKDCYQSLLILRNELIEKANGAIFCPVKGKIKLAVKCLSVKKVIELKSWI